MREDGLKKHIKVENMEKWATLYQLERWQQDCDLAMNAQIKKIENETKAEDFKVWEMSELQVSS